MLYVHKPRIPVDFELDLKVSCVAVQKLLGTLPLFKEYRIYKYHSAICGTFKTVQHNGHELTSG